MRSMTSADPDLGARPVFVRTPAADDAWTLAPARSGRDWSLTLTSPSRTWNGSGPDCFKALRHLRAQLDNDRVLVGVNGARPNSWSSGMQCDMGEGRVTYLCELGSKERPETVRTLDPAPLDSVGSIAEQDNFHDRWLAERRR
jgi:hypothetical protein